MRVCVRVCVGGWGSPPRACPKPSFIIPHTNTLSHAHTHTHTLFHTHAHTHTHTHTIPTQSLHGQPQRAAYGACKTGTGPVWDEATQLPFNWEVVSQSWGRTYAPAVAGHTRSMKFDNTTKDFVLVYDLDTAIEMSTDIFLCNYR